MVFGLLGGGSPSKNKNKPGFKSIPGCTALVTGSSGLCGSRLVEMLLERGAQTVICFDMAVPDDTLKARFEAVQKTTGGKLLFCHGRKDGNLTDTAAVERAFALEPQIDVVYHIAALVGPFHDKELYHAVNYEGTMTILEMCRKYKVPKLV